jgi:cyclophilin family peptidyl-prolyl cis-trans isomerase
MPKTTKRAASKRAARIAKAHATQLPKLDVKEPQQRRSPGQKPPARGLARYPWATALTIALIALGVFLLYFNHIGPFAPPPKNIKLEASQTATAVAKSVQATSTAVAGPARATATAVVKAMPASQTKAIAASPCLKPSIIQQITDTSPAPTAAQSAQITRTYKQAPAMTIDTGKIYCAGINTTRGLIVVELEPKLAPKTVNNFVFLAQHKFYDGLVFHRVVPSAHIIQGGDPKGNGSGGPGYQFADEKVQGNYLAGTIAMANSGPNSNGSQFFINLADNSKEFQKSYNLFGQIVQGLDVATMIQGPDPDNAATKNIKPDVMNHVVVVSAS